MSDCRELTHLPACLRVGPNDPLRGPTTIGSLIARNCTALEFLPDRLDVCHLDVSGCTRLLGWREGASAHVERLLARGCARLTTLPDQLTLTRLVLSDCVNLRSLPAGLLVRSEIEIANTGLTDLPNLFGMFGCYGDASRSITGSRLSPGSITVEEISRSPTRHSRQVLLERFGLERFVTSAQCPGARYRP